MPKTDAKLDLLRTSPWFERCSGRQLLDVARRGEILRVPAGLDVHPASERLRWVYLVLDGRLERRAAGLAPAAVAVGDAFGDDAAVRSESVSGAALVAATDAVLFVLEQRAFLDVLDLPGVGRQCLRSAADRSAAPAPVSSRVPATA